MRELCRDYQHIDPVTELVPVRPVVHYMMGGVHADINGATTLPSALTRRARPHASASAGQTGWARTRCPSCWCSETAPAGPQPSDTRPGSARIQLRCRPKPATRKQRLERDLNRRAETGKDASPTSAPTCRPCWRPRPGSTEQPHLTKAAEQIRELQEERFADAGIDDPQPFNTELLAFLELSGCSTSPRRSSNPPRTVPDPAAHTSGC